MSENLRPDTDSQVRELVAWAAAEGAPVEIRGAGTKRGLGRPLQATHTLDLSGLAGITLYEAEELVLSARAGTTVAAIEETIAASGQELAFEPPDFGPLYGRPAGEQTIGGVLSANLAGSRRIKAGSGRDHFLGVQMVTGRGELIKSGGRVVKNVTGYDLCKVIAGAHGTLGAMVDVTVKVLPRGEKTRTALVLGLEDRRAVEALTAALGSAHEVSGAAHLPAEIAALSGVSLVADAGGAVTAIRVEGPGPSVEHRCRAIRHMLADFGPTEELHSANSRALWREVTDVAPFAADRSEAIWRLSVPPTAGVSVAAAIGAGGSMRHYFDWGGGLIWLALAPGEDARADEVRRAIEEAGGHATLIRAPEGLRASVPVFQPQSPGLAALTKRIKASFDPQAVLNPGRMYAGV